jgi:hypothetical protein
METYVGENPPKSKGVVWVHHDTYNDINSPLVLEVSKSGKYTEVQSAKTLKKIADLQESKADLVEGKVPSSQLPSFVDDVIEVDNYAALPVTGETGKIYVTKDTNTSYRWTGTAYVKIGNPLDYATQAEAEGNAENTKVMTALRTFQNVVNNIKSRSFSAAALTNPYTSGLTPKWIGEVVVNATSMEFWVANSIAASVDSWQIDSQGKFGGTLITDAHSIIRNGFYSAVSTAANLPTATESFYIQALCSNLSTTSAILIAMGLTTGKMYMQRKISGVWGAWIGGITQAELSYLSGTTSNVQGQLDSLGSLKADRTYVDGDKMDVTAHAITALQSQIEALQLKIAEITSGQVVIPALMTDRLTSVSDNMHISGSGAPTVPPDYLYQEYIDTVAKVKYTAYGTTDVSDWKLN